MISHFAYERLQGSEVMPEDISYNSLMKTANISEIKNKLSAYLDMVRHGETILIMDRSRPVALLQPAHSDASLDPSGRLSRLERAGLLRGPRKPQPKSSILDKPPPGADGEPNILAALLAEREEGR
ncbi:MAG TPA: type II toxin-antitoxin system prevent-host-death family antitoxin [Candidatus Obscuribacterales bacterium]